MSASVARNILLAIFALSKIWAEGQGKAKILTSENFSATVFNRSKYVFVYFHSSKCEECQGLSQVIEDLAEEMKARHNIIIATVDVGQEKLDEEFQPGSLTLFKSGDNARVKFEKGKKNLKALRLFLELHCRVGLEHSNSVRDRNKKFDLKNTDKFVRDEL